jgi:SAM-dependent methyltransferase
MRLRRSRPSAALSPDPPEAPAAGCADDGLIDPDELARTYSIEDLNASADEYFARIENWDTQLAKPCASPTEAPVLLADFGAVLSGLDLWYGATVLDFGAGSGWTSWLLSQLGCHVIVSDVSAVALQMAAERYARLPLIGKVPEPSFLRFDGRRLDLDDAAVDRIACNDAFHHVPNPSDVLREFARVLKPGGVCVMAEPGPEHATLPQSQAEMRNHRVIERNIVVEDLAEQAKDAGFAATYVAVYCGIPSYVPVDTFASYLDGSPAAAGALVHSFMYNHRLIRLQMPGVEVSDSRRRLGLSASLDITITGNVAEAVIENSGTAVWLQEPGVVGQVQLGAHLLDRDGNLVDFDFCRLPLRLDASRVGPGERVAVSGELPRLEPGEHIVEFDLVAEHVTWFADDGGRPVRVRVTR